MQVLTVGRGSSFTVAVALRPAEMWPRADPDGVGSIPRRPDPSRGSYETVTGVPTGISLASARIFSFGTRMQPCEMRPGMSCGSFVP